MKIFLTLIIIVTIGLALRFFNLGNVPNSLNWDEVSWGYNAYSILTTGKDEHGVPYPMSFKAFGDYKQPVYIYLDIIPIKLFGLDAFAVRFPSAFFGTLSIISIFFLAKEIFVSEKKKNIIAISASFLFAVSPWSIQFSRVAYEANIAVFFIITGVALTFFGLRTKNNLASITGVILLGLSTYSYHSAKVFTPILLLILLSLSVYRYKVSKKIISLLLILFFIITIFWILDSRTTARGRSVTFASNPTALLENDLIKSDKDVRDGNTYLSLLHNRRFTYINKYIENYLMHFDPNYLFITGDDARHHAPRTGNIYPVLLPFVLFGFIKILQKRNTEGLFVLSWLLIAPLASSLAIDSPNASRSLVMLPAFILITSVGLIFAIQAFKGLKRTLFISLLSVVFLINFIYYSNNYFNHTNNFHQLYWQYGYKESIDFTNQLTGNKIYFLDDIEEGYMFYLFHTKYDPAKYLSIGGTGIKNQQCFKIDNRYFGICNTYIKKGDIYVTKSSYFSKKDVLLKKIKIDDLNSIYIYRSND